MISAKVVADSKNQYKDRITTMVVTFPRIILAEFNTHRMFSRNSASSRAIPTKKMLKSILDNPFIPIAWQKDHSGMQGTEYFDNNEKFQIEFLKDYMFTRLQEMYRDSKDQDIEDIVIDSKVLEMYNELFKSWEYQFPMTFTEFWLSVRDKVIQSTILFYCLGVTKQICNRLLEPFMWHTVIVTATEWENFFALRCPQYEWRTGIEDRIYRSRKDIAKYQGHTWTNEEYNDQSLWLMANRGQAEIHMMALAEAMWDAYNESTPKELKAGEWHIPFGNNIDLEVGKWKFLYPEHISFGKDMTLEMIKVATARCARISYTVVGEEGKEANYENDIKLHDRLASSGHWSPFEHCAQCMTGQEYIHSLSGPFTLDTKYIEYSGQDGGRTETTIEGSKGWSGNFRGFKQYRKTFINENITNGSK